MTVHPLRKFQGLNTPPHMPPNQGQRPAKSFNSQHFLRHPLLCRKEHERGPSSGLACFPFHYLTFHDRNVRAYATTVGRMRKQAPGSHLSLYFSTVFYHGTILKLSPHTLSLSISSPKFPAIAATLRRLQGIWSGA